MIKIDLPLDDATILKLKVGDLVGFKWDHGNRSGCSP